MERSTAAGNIFPSNVEVSDFAQTGVRHEAQPPRYGKMSNDKASRGKRCQMSEADQFRQYAEEALRWALASTAEKERLSLMELARTWAQAAIASDPPPIGAHYSPTDHRTAR
jgi:hypothetical protein